MFSAPGFQEKRHQSLEGRRKAQEMASVREEKRGLQAEVETLRCLERELRQKVAKLETALHKVAPLGSIRASFAR